MKLFDFTRFCNDHSIRYVSEGHKHTQAGWLNLPCPFCAGHDGYHLGWDSNLDRFNCWRCGFHKHTDVIMILLHVDKHEAVKLWKKYQGRPVRREKKQSKPKARIDHDVKLPIGTTELKKVHRDYLRGRKFNPKKLKRLWNLKATGPIGPYKFRIIAPIYLDDVMISFQGRDITDKHELKYKACRKDDERLLHQHSLYGIDQVPGDTVVIVEGITDVWRLGPGAVATFGIDYTRAQVKMLKRFKRLRVFFDSADSQAVKQAELLAHDLSIWDNEVEIVECDYDDPGSMPQIEASKLMKELLS